MNLFNNLETRQNKFYESPFKGQLPFYTCITLISYYGWCLLCAVLWLPWGNLAFSITGAFGRHCYTHASLQIVWQSYQQTLHFWQIRKEGNLCVLGSPHQHFISTHRWAYPLGISPTTSMLYLLGRSQKCVMTVAAMTCWLKRCKKKKKKPLQYQQPLSCNYSIPLV